MSFNMKTLMALFIALGFASSHVHAQKPAHDGGMFDSISAGQTNEQRQKILEKLDLELLVLSLIHI